MKCSACGADNHLTVDYDCENNLSFYCAECGMLLEKYYNVKPVVEDKVGEGVVIIFNYK